MKKVVIFSGIFILLVGLSYIISTLLGHCYLCVGCQSDCLSKLFYYVSGIGLVISIVYYQLVFNKVYLKQK